MMQAWSSCGIYLTPQNETCFSCNVRLPRANNRRQTVGRPHYSAFVIADVTETSPNVFYEIGFAEGPGRPIIATAKMDTKLPFDIVDTPVTFWNSLEDLKLKLEPLVNELKTGLGKGYNATGEKDH